MNTPAEHLVRAADVSVYSGHITAKQWRRARARHHVELAVVGSWHGSRANQYAEATLAAARAAGLKVATYIVVTDDAKAIGYGLDACGIHVDSLEFVAIDAELRGVSEKGITDSVRAVHDRGRRAMIYTGKWYWAGRLGDPKWAPRIPLWDSSYNGRQTLDEAGYGGWGRPVGHQYKGTNTELGFSCDLSVFAKDWLEANEPATE